jgi:hypothetical protein
MKLPAGISKHTMYFFNERIKPEILFIAAMVCFPIFLFLPSSGTIWLAAVLFSILTLLRRGKVSIMPSVIITAGIIIFALLSPYGKVLVHFGSFRITEGALKNGLHKSGILIGMVFLSQFAVSSKLHFPGKFGIFLSKTFSIFDELTAKKISIRPGNIISSIDERLTEIWSEGK